MGCFSLFQKFVVCSDDDIRVFQVHPDDAQLVVNVRINRTTKTRIWSWLKNSFHIPATWHLALSFSKKRTNIGEIPNLQIDSSSVFHGNWIKSRESVFLNLSYLWVCKCIFQTLTITFHFKNNETVLLFHLGKTMTSVWWTK